MKYQRSALVATGLALAAMAYLMMLGGTGRDSHSNHQDVASAQGILVDQVPRADSDTTPGSQTVHTHPPGTPSPDSPPASDPVSTAGLTADQQSVVAVEQSLGVAEVIGPDPANLRQVGLAEAAGEPKGAAAGAGVPGAAVAGSADGSTSPFIDPDAAGVNEGTKKQAADVPLQVAPPVPPQDILPGVGQASGCVIGYGRGAVCLPQTPPSHAGHGQLGREDLSVYWTCAEVRSLLPDGVVVDGPGADRLGLDSNADGTACGVGDS